MIKRLPLGIYGTNCYIVVDDNTKETAIIDPAGGFNELKDMIENNSLKVKYIILTHGHGDHIGAVPKLKKYTDALLCMHENDSHLVDTSDTKSFMLTGILGISLKADKFLADGEVLELGSSKLYIYHTPGHTQGSICIKSNNELFTGDTLFAGSIGRTDLLGGSYEQIIKSIKDKLLVLSDELSVYPGHGPASTLEIERRNNPFLK